MATRDDAPFVNEDGQKTETRSANVLSGDSGLLTGAPKAQRPDFGSVAGMRAKFPAQILVPSRHEPRGAAASVAHSKGCEGTRVRCQIERGACTKC